MLKGVESITNYPQAGRYDVQILEITPKLQKRKIISLLFILTVLPISFYLFLMGEYGI